MTKPPYRHCNHNMGLEGYYETGLILTGLAIGVLFWSIAVFLSGIDIYGSHGMPRSIPLIYLALSFLFIWTNREFARWYLTGNTRKDIQPKKVLIWGYSEMAQQLAQNLLHTSGYEPVGIIDEDKSLHFLKADDIKIFPPDHIDVLIPREQISEIFIDNEIVSKEKRLEIVSRLDAHSVKLKILPSMDNIIIPRFNSETGI